MKKSSILLLLLIIALQACRKQDEPLSVISEPDFNIVYSNSVSSQVYAAARTMEGGYVLAGIGKSLTGDPGNSDAWVLQLDMQGKVKWQKTFGGSALDGADAIASTREGGFAIAGYTYSTDGDITGNHGNSDAWVVNIDPNGNKVWQHALGGSANDMAASIIETSDGGFILAGQTSSTNGDVINNHGSTDALVIKLDRNGNKLWQKTLGGTGSEGALSIIESSEGGYLMAGWTNSQDGDVSGYHPGWGMNVGSLDGWVVRMDKDGNLLWTKAFGGSRSEMIYSITTGMDHSYIITGDTKSNNDGDVGVNHGNFDTWVVNIDKEGKLLWQKSLGGSDNDISYFILPTQDGGYMLAGLTSSNDGDVSGNHGGEDAWLVKLDKVGNKQWQRALGGSGGEVARVVFQRANGSYVVVGAAGSTDGDLAGQQNAGGPWIITMKAQ